MTTLKYRERRKFTSFYRGPYKINEVLSHSNLKLEDEKTNKFVEIPYNHLKTIKHEKNYSLLSNRHNETQQLRKQKGL